MVALRYAARTNVGLGSKSRNEDSAYAGPELLVLCDGMGGHAAGDVASSLVVSELVHLDGESHGADDSLDILERALDEANSRLADVMEVYPDSDGMGTTCIAMMRTGTKLAVANIGDSRAYLLRDGRLTQITKDHSFVQKLLDEGRISKDEAQHHPQRSLVTRVLTGRPEDTPDLSLRELRVGDRLLLCSDGLTDYVAEDTVAELLRRDDRSPGQVADELVQVALRAATRDNVTVVVADLVHAREGTTKPQVVGAASERRRAQTIGQLTPAEKAAQLTREATGTTLADPPVLAEEGPSSPVLRWLRRSLVAAALVVVLGAAGWGAWAWSQQQYFVGEQDGVVTIYRGVSQDLGPVSLSTAEDLTDLRVDALPAFYQDQVRRTLSADDRAGAETIVTELRQLAQGRCVPVVVLPDGTRTSQVPPGAVAVTLDPDEAARAALPVPTGAAGDGADDAVATATAGEPATSGAGGLRDPLDAGVGLGDDSAGATDDSVAATADDARPTVQVLYPEGCP
ncbi:PP2C family protein-serine/threonine phosphatase [Ornithinimicrobium pekingense]|uniref:Serine/threonine protein phosphatase n=1 Tax=Ornithinimicrobium pekingense TaxID=384677 RepID=A0ABQ2F3J0_9MICO|nr:protein phosphatase 2C domain-containing protein [Ornithinimicrobium pekingense]GGK55829.1 serine/threonine protein phosphatase [Ornithinimicrobium pekingense]